MVFFRFENFRPSQYDIIWLKELGIMSLDNSVNTIASFELFCHIVNLQFYFVAGIMTSPFCLQWLLITIYKGATHYRVTVLARVPHV